MIVKIHLLFQNLDVPGLIPLDEELGAWTPADVPLRRLSISKAWIEASFLAQAPRLDLELIKALSTYDKADLEIRDVALSKLLAHLWYVSEEVVGLSFSTPTCPVTPKRPWLRPYDEKQLTGMNRLRKGTLFRKSWSDISTGKTSSVDVPTTFSGSL